MFQAPAALADIDHNARGYSGKLPARSISALAESGFKLSSPDRLKGFGPTDFTVSSEQR